MTNKEFDILLEKRISRILIMMKSKAKEYAREDRLANFKAGAKIGRTTPEQCLLGYMNKHLVSMIDIVEDINNGIRPSDEYVEEKLGDVVNYVILLEMLIKERNNCPICNGKMTSFKQTHYHCKKCNESFTN